MVKPRYLVPSTVVCYSRWCRCSWNLNTDGPSQRTSYTTGILSGLTTSSRTLRHVSARVVRPKVESPIIDDRVDRDDLYLARVVEELWFSLGGLFEHFRDSSGGDALFLA